jgi:N-acetylglucosamine-6-sulfatase
VKDLTTNRVALILVLVVVLLAGDLITVRLRGETPESPAAAPARSNAPNVLVVMTDDQTLEEMRVLHNVTTLLGAQGTTFSDFYTTTPNCCPSRSGFYTGQYPHNTKVRDNIPPLGGANSFVPRERDSIGVWMQQAGYYTAQIGKFLNGWGNPEKPDEWTGGIAPLPGWDHWFVDIDPSTYGYYGYRVSVDGTERDYGSAPADYQTDVTGRETVDTIKRATDTGKPWFIAWTPMSPHVQGKESITAEGQVPGGIAVAADKYRDTFKDEAFPPGPSLAFGPAAAATADVKAKPGYIRKRVADHAPGQPEMRSAYQKELEALQSIDEWVGNIYRTLQDLHQLDNTEIIFWSDNGLFHGQHGLTQKNALYEEAVHVPLIIRGPGFPAGTVADQLTLNIDLAPTILALAGATASVAMDGRDLAPLARNPNVAKDRAILLEDWYSYSTTAVQGVRVGQWAYLTWSTGEDELYNLKTDPYQMKNVADDPGERQTVDQLRRDLDGLRSCVGSACEITASGRSG